MKNYYVLPSLSVIRLVGRDREMLLQNLCTQDLRGIVSGTGRELFITDVKGRTIGHGIVCGFDNSLLLLLANADSSKVLSHLDRYIIREDVQLIDETSDLVWYALGEHIPNKNMESAPREIYSFRPLDGSGDTSAASSNNSLATEEKVFSNIIRWPISSPDGFVIGIPREHVAAFQGTLEVEGYDALSAEEFTFARIATNWPWFGIDFSEQNLPQEIDRDREAISFTKGCYLGQETIARLDALGQIQKKLCRIQINYALTSSADKIKNHMAKEVGWITSAAVQISTNTTLAFAFLRRGDFEIGTQLTISGHTCEVI